MPIFLEEVVTGVCCLVMAAGLIDDGCCSAACLLRGSRHFEGQWRETVFN
jgi:hypothetical protein